MFSLKKFSLFVGILASLTHAQQVVASEGNSYFQKTKNFMRTYKYHLGVATAFAVGIAYLYCTRQPQLNNSPLNNGLPKPPSNPTTRLSPLAPEGSKVPGVPPTSATSNTHGFAKRGRFTSRKNQ